MPDTPQPAGTPGPSLSPSTGTPATPETLPTQGTLNPGTASGPRLALQAGTRPLPEYELIHLLGRGGFGEVWKARGPGGFDVALKFVLLGEQAGRVEMRALELMKSVR